MSSLVKGCLLFVLIGKECCSLLQILIRDFNTMDLVLKLKRFTNIAIRAAYSILEIVAF